MTGATASGLTQGSRGKLRFRPVSDGRPGVGLKHNKLREAFSRRSPCELATHHFVAKLGEDAGITADAAGILAERDIEDVVQAILDGPVAPDGLGQGLCRGLEEPWVFIAI
jgi:hypothetical protein